ncbi:MAG: hypothetical protein KIT22_01075 [Verrucomicrobiae bacterium]|nr:hypothetical protein [Verrucomicrobiae bacterium]
MERIVHSPGAAGDPGVHAGHGGDSPTLNALRAAHLPEACVFLPLHGDLPPEEQDRAFQSFDRRKIVVATNVAETSVTIDASGMCRGRRAARISPRHDAARESRRWPSSHQPRLPTSAPAAPAAPRPAPAGGSGPKGHLDRPNENIPEIHAGPCRSRPAPPFAGHPARRGLRLAGPARSGGGRAERLLVSSSPGAAIRNHG